MKSLTSQRGFNLIELMVSVVISMLVLAGIASMFTTQKQASRTQDAAGQLQEGARVVMQSFLANLKQAGYRRLQPNSEAVMAYSANSWQDVHVATSPVSFVSAGTDTMTVRYEPGDVYNPATGAGGDCTGAAPTIIAASNASIPVVVNTYSVNAAGQLVCSNVAGASVVLANNVLDFQVRAGVSATPSAEDYNIVGFTTPNLVIDLATVRAVEVCFVLQSDNSAGQTSAAANAYMGCNGPVTMPTADRRLRQIFRQTVTLRNSVLKRI